MTGYDLANPSDVASLAVVAVVVGGYLYVAIRLRHVPNYLFPGPDEFTPTPKPLPRNQPTCYPPLRAVPTWTDDSDDTDRDDAERDDADRDEGWERRPAWADWAETPDHPVRVSVTAVTSLPRPAPASTESRS